MTRCFDICRLRLPQTPSPREADTWQKTQCSANAFPFLLILGQRRSSAVADHCSALRSPQGSRLLLEIEILKGIRLKGLVAQKRWSGIAPTLEHDQTLDAISTSNKRRNTIAYSRSTSVPQKITPQNTSAKTVPQRSRFQSGRG